MIYVANFYIYMVTLPLEDEVYVVNPTDAEGYTWFILLSDITKFEVPDLNLYFNV